LFQKRSGGAFYREVHIPNQGRDQAPLNTYDREVAEKLGKELLSHLLLGTANQLPGPVRIGELWRRYSTECQDYLDNHKHSKEADISKARNLLAYFGDKFDIRTLSPNDVAQYMAKRKAGGIRHGKGFIPKKVNQTTVRADLALLRRMIRWACLVRLPSGQRWLDHNPIDGMRFEREKNPARPIASIERYEKTRAKIRELAETAEFANDRMRWIRLELALFLAEGTGRRRGSIAGLRWEDCDFAQNKIRWRAEHDKKGKEWIIPMPASFMGELRQFQVRVGAITGFLFPSLYDLSRHMRVEMLTQWLTEAERKAGIPKLKGGLWHPYRRKWASERMDKPLRALADAGGWKDTTTILTCYQQTDEATLLAVMSESRKRSERLG
jgi:integrase